VTDYSNLLQECEKWIRAGAIAPARAALNSVNTAQVPREFTLPLAKVCRRTGLLAVGLRLLSPVVRESARSLATNPTPQELAEYAVLLQRNDCLREAWEILEKLPAEEVPEALLYRSFWNFNQWKYAAAIPDLHRYLAFPLDPYAQRVGRVNLTAALAMEHRHDEASALVNELISECDKLGLARLHANCLELRAQIHFQNGDFNPALLDLTQAEGILSASGVHDALFITKWQAAIAAFKCRSTTPLKNFIKQAVRSQEWEAAREAELQGLRIAHDPALFRNLFFGTPLPAFRLRIGHELGVDVALQPEFTVIGPESGPCLDIVSGELDGRSAFIPGSKAHQTVEVLSRDLYRPANLGSLFSHIYPEEYFDIFSSPGRVHQTLTRTREWLRRSGTGLELVERQGQYVLKVPDGLRLRLPKERSPVNWFEAAYARMGRHFQDRRIFSSSALRSHLEMTDAESKRFLGWAVENRRIEKIGRGRGSAYRLRVG
jgi:hypothetical protein